MLVWFRLALSSFIFVHSSLILIHSSKFRKIIVYLFAFNTLFIVTL